ncbi:MAG: ATP-binding protein [Acidobacteria bacterium]|nr:MAG: ATP-binding protein [Acidobacteriota bacterium]
MASAENEVRVSIKSDEDILSARQEGRELGDHLGFGPSELAVIATAISELARNLLLYAKNGNIICWAIEREPKKGIVIQATDEGPGIPDVEAVLRDGYSTSGGLGLGLPGVRRMMDEFAIVSHKGRGTTVTTIKWKS